MNKNVTASLEISIWLNCPHCDFYINLMDESDTNGHDHNENGHILRQACPNETWTDAHEKFNVEEVECSHCKGVFDVKKLEW